MAWFESLPNSCFAPVLPRLSALSCSVDYITWWSVSHDLIKACQKSPLYEEENDKQGIELDELVFEVSLPMIYRIGTERHKVKKKAPSTKFKLTVYFCQILTEALRFRLLGLLR